MSAVVVYLVFLFGSSAAAVSSKCGSDPIVVGCAYGEWKTYIDCRADSDCSKAEKVFSRDVIQYDCTNPKLCTNVFKTETCPSKSIIRCRRHSSFGTFCKQRQNGHYAVSRCTATYVKCHRNDAIVKTCPRREVFDSNRLECRSKNRVSKCRQHERSHREHIREGVGKCENEYFVSDNSGEKKLAWCRKANELFDERSKRCVNAKKLREKCFYPDNGCQNGLISLGACKEHYKFCWNDKSIVLKCAPNKRFDSVSKECKKQFRIPECPVANKCYILGGLSSLSAAPPYGQSVETFDFTSQTFTQISELPFPLAYLAAAALNGFVYAIGGYNIVSDETVNTVEVLKSGVWSTAPNLNIFRGGLAAVTYSDTIYAIGGFDINFNSLNSTEVFDPTFNNWTLLEAQMNTSRAYFGAGIIGDGLYAVGGYVSDDNVDTNTVEVFNLTTNQWSPVASMNTAREGHAVVVLNDKLYAIGGSDDIISLTLSSVEVYDSISDTWSYVANLSVARAYGGAVVRNGLIYAIGGVDAFFDYIYFIEVYNPTLNKWTILNGVTLPYGDYDFGITLDNAGSECYIIGGYDQTYQLDTAAEVFDFDTKTWTPITPLPFTLAGEAATTLNGYIYAIGGAIDISGDISTNQVEVYDPIRSNSWTSSASLNIARAFHAAVTYNGQIYAVGGCNGVTCFNSTEVYDSTLNKWAILNATMSSPRAYIGACIIGDILYAVSGFNGTDDINTVEALNLKKNRWSPVAPLNTAREGHAVVVLNDQLYAIGGRNSESNTYLNTVEVYNPITGTWSFSANTSIPRGYGGAVVDGGLIYLIGGYSAGGALGINFISFIEVYNPSSNSWTTLPTGTLPYGVGYFGITTS